MENGTCPKCGAQDTELLTIEAGMRLRLTQSNVENNPPPFVCKNCYSKLLTDVSEGARLMAQENAKEQNKRALWRTRTRLIKEGRDHMNKKAYSEAAVAYEKYIRVLELANNTPPGQLNPLDYDRPGKDKELTIMASVFFDLLRIYDTSERYGDRQYKVADRLAQIVHLTPAHGNILSRARAFQKVAKNPDAIRSFLQKAQHRGHFKKCFIATAAFDSPLANEVRLLRRFRDQVLSKHLAGKFLVEFYYLVSPPIANFIEDKPLVKRRLRKILTAIALRLADSFNLQR